MNPAACSRVSEQEAENGLESGRSTGGNHLGRHRHSGWHKPSPSGPITTSASQPTTSPPPAPRRSGVQGAGVELSWVDCWYRDTQLAETVERCRQPLKANEVILRLQAANPLPGRRYVSMGFALVNISEGMPFLATVFADLVRSVSRDAHLDYRLLLGRAIAHEIGHLLLDTNRHADTGLMRAGWSNAELRQNADVDWTFGASEGERHPCRRRDADC